jgi:peptidoglycan hydrolase-like protein with peptidoglycan-binding domain
MHSRPGPHAERSGRTTSPDPMITDARVWIVGTLVLFLVSCLLSFAAARWLPGLMTGTSTSTSEATPVEQSDNSQGVFPKPVIPIVIRQKTSLNAEVSDLPPQTEISSPLITVVDTANTVSTPQLLDLREIENTKQVQQRLIDLGFLFGAADGSWGQRSRQALQEFRAANGIGESDTWDEATQERLLRAPDVKAASRSEISFIGGWGSDVAECRDSPITITARRAEGFGVSCEFHSSQRESSNGWRMRAKCSSNTERWNANIRLTVSASKLTWSSERGTTTYVRCPVASASR